MNRELLYDALLQPEKLKFIRREELERVAEEYPYFNPAQVLLARIYQNSGDHRFSDQLLAASNTAGDRVSLYHFLKHSGEELQAEATQVPVAGEPATPVAEAIQVAPPPPVHEEEPTPEAPTVSAEVSEEEITVASIPIPVVAGRPVVAPEPEQEEEEEESSVPEDLLDREVLIRAVQSTIEQDVIEDLRETRTEEPVSDAETEPQPAAMVRPVPVSPPKKREAEPEEEEISDPFAAYLMRRAREIGYEEHASGKITGTEHAEDDIHSDDIHSDDTADDPAEHDAPEAEESRPAPGRVAGPPLGLSGGRKRHQQELIDRFIQSNPRITPGRSDDYAVDDIARTSITDDLSLVSETMAELLASQGKKEKARKVYRKLMELHPEKSIYFAARLKNLDKLK